MSLSQESDRELAEARRVLVDNQNGGRHRRSREIGKSIGQGSDKEKAKAEAEKAAPAPTAEVTAEEKK